LQDPQSLHKYLYCHANPVNNIDPSGNNALTIGLVLFAVALVLLVGFAIGTIMYRGAMIASGARGSSVYLDFSEFDISGIKFNDGNKPDKDIVKQRVIALMNSKYDKAEVRVSELSKDDKTTLTTPILSFSNKSRVFKRADGNRKIVFGQDTVGGVRPKIYLGNFIINELNGRLKDNEELARAIAFLACHEVGHSYKLKHMDESDNIMRSRVVLDNDAPTGDETISGLLKPSTFTNEQIEVIKNVAATGRKW